MTSRPTTAPFSPGSIFLGLHTHPLPVDRLVSTLREEARAAEDAGFDGVGFSEHHGGFPGYLPNPVQWCAIVLGDLRRAWAAACPTLLPLRPAAGVVEDLAWLAAAFPGRVGAGFAAGYQEQDFDLLESDFGSRTERHWAALPGVVSALSGRARGALGNDPAVAALAATPVPVVSGVGGPVGARRAAQAGAGMLVTSLTDARRARELVEAHRQAGGKGPNVLIRRIWVGTPPGSLDIEVARYRSAGSDTTWLVQTDEDPLVSGDATEVTGRLTADLCQSGVDALNLRIHLNGASPQAVREQIEIAGAEVLPALREAFLGAGDAPV
jgi:alkanesulfonate monooxygenase SsuD/methylene tetrahydromethanopterin reductase-like flavin-dependent oxidoreductase (luciferase family)